MIAQSITLHPRGWLHDFVFLDCEWDTDLHYLELRPRVSPGSLGSHYDDLLRAQLSDNPVIWDITLNARPEFPAVLKQLHPVPEISEWTILKLRFELLQRLNVN